VTFRYASDPPRVLVTRPAEDAAAIAHAMGHAGFEPVVVPLLERVWRVDDVARAAAEHPEVDRVIVTSATTAQVIATAAPSAWRGARWAAVGEATADRLEQLGYPVDLVPARATAAQLVAALGDVRGLRVLYPRADLASPATCRSLEQAGAVVVDVVAYDNVAPPDHERRLRHALPLDATTLLSGSAAARLAAAVPERRERLGKVVCIGPSTERVARAAGLPVHAVADPHSLQGVILALTELFSA
jgi:uroporphyrinogen-III synthase